MDKQTGFCTRSILCAPIFARSGHAIGVIQMINKQCGSFDASDEFTMSECIQMVLRALVVMRSQEYRNESAKGHKLLLKTGLESLLKRDFVLKREAAAAPGWAMMATATRSVSDTLHSRSLAELVEDRRPQDDGCAARRSARFIALRARRHLMMQYGNKCSQLNKAKQVSPHQKYALPSPDRAQPRVPCSACPATRATTETDLHCLLPC